MKNILNFGNEFLDDADEKDRKAYKQMMKSRIQM